MKKGFKKAKRLLLLLTLAILTILAFSSVLTPVKAASAILKMNPSYATIGQDGQPVPPITQPVTISIEVESVSDLWSWQVVIYYDNNTLYTQNSWLWLPPNHVFAGHGYSEMPATTGSDAQGHFIMKSITLYGGEPTFTGSGVLCKVNFSAAGTPGISNLKFTTPIGSVPGKYETYMWDSFMDEIPATAVEGTVEVKGTTTTKEPSNITISVDKSTVYLGDNVTISGNVTLENGTPKPNVDITIQNRILGELDFSPLQTVKTDSEGRYNYTWAPTDEDIPVDWIGPRPVPRSSAVYELQAKWLGDETTFGSQSGIINLTLLRPPTHLKVVAPTVLGDEKNPKPPPTKDFIVSVNVTEVIDLFSWQIKLRYEPKYLELINVTLPESHIFQNKSFTPDPITPIIDTTEGYILSNANLTAGEEPFNGDGTLFQMAFRGIRPTPTIGTKLQLIREQTFLVNSTGGSIPAILEDAWIDVFVKVEEAAKIKSYIAIEVNPTTILISENATIKGNVTLEGGAPKANVTVTIEYKSLDITSWTKLIDKRADANGFYNYTFVPRKEPNEYTFRASWKGDEETQVATSAEATLIVTEKGATAGVDMQFYVTVAAIAVVAFTDLSATIIYFRRLRGQGKPET